MPSSRPCLWRYLDVHREKQNIRRAFGYHLPPQVVDELAGGTDALTADGRLTHGICLATDAEQIHPAVGAVGTGGVA